MVTVPGSIERKVSVESGCQPAGCPADAVLLSGSIGLDEEWTGCLPRTLLPLPGATLIGTLYRRLAQSIQGTVSICTHGDARLLRSHFSRPSLSLSHVRIHEDRLPRGTAGCIKSAVGDGDQPYVLVCGATVWLEDEANWLIEQHRSHQNSLTVYCVPHQVWATGTAETRLKPVSLYCCNREVLDLIPDVGYQDLKEQLIPLLKRAGMRVGAVSLRGATLNVADWSTYLHAITRVLSVSFDSKVGEYKELAPAIWCGQGTRIAHDARIVGPALIGHGTVLEPGSVVIGPTMVGDQCVIGSQSWIVRSVVPAETAFPAESSVSDCIVADEKFLAQDAEGVPGEFDSRLTERTTILRGSESGRRSSAGVSSSQPGTILAGGAAILATFLWAFWSNFVDLWGVWQASADYGAGILVPPAVAYLLYRQAPVLRALPLGWSWVGAGVFVAGAALNWMGYYFLFSSLSNLGLVVCVHGLFLALLGGQAYRKVFYRLMFLLLMFPLPGRIHDALMLPLQEYSTRVSATLLEIGGIPVERFGHVLEIGGRQLAVAEACNGLRMAAAFVIVTGLLSFLIQRPRWQRFVVFASSIPIAIACNIARLVVTAYLYSQGYEWLAQGMFHDLAGFLMMPLAVSMIFVELWILSNLWSPPPKEIARVGVVDRSAMLSAP